MLMTCCSEKSILVNILLNRKSILVKRHASIAIIARRREHLSAYLHVCVSWATHNHEKNTKNSRKNHQTPSEKNVPAGSNLE
jgi:hypothetical protein